MSDLCIVAITEKMDWLLHGLIKYYKNKYMTGINERVEYDLISDLASDMADIWRMEPDE